MKFEPKNKLIVLKSSGNPNEKIAFVQNLYDKASEKINHFDRLRQQLLNFAFVIFSALLVFVIRSDNALMQVIACLGVSGLMVAFRYLDHRYHTSTHGFSASMHVFSHVIASLLDNPNEEVEFYQYCQEGENTVQKWSLQTKIYLMLVIVNVVLLAILIVAKNIGY